MTTKRTYSKEEVEFLLNQQINITILSLNIRSEVLVYPNDFDRFKDIIEQSRISIDDTLTYFNKK